MSGTAAAATNIAYDTVTKRNFGTITGEQVQRVKVSFGPSDTADDVGGEPFGALTVNNGYTTLLYDAWAGSSVDTTDKWTVTGTTPVVANSGMTMVTTASSYNAIQAKDVVRATAGYALVRNGIQLETPASNVGAIGAGRFWGFGTTATTPAAAVLAQNGIGFEVDQATGALLAVTYFNGARTTIATLTFPTDGLNHGFGVYARATVAYWLIDSVVVAKQTFPNVAVQELPPLIVRQNAASFTGTPVFVNTAHLTADTSRPATGIADPVIGARQARVNSAGQLTVIATQQALTKGTQGTSGVSTQDLKDAGRVSFAAATVIGGVTAVTTEALLSMVPVRDGTAAATNTTIAVTSGKRLRIQAITVSARSTGATVLSARFALRMNPSGAVTATSPILALLSTTQQAAALAEAGDSQSITFPDGLEISGTQQIGITQVASAVSGSVYVSIIGYEY